MSVSHRVKSSVLRFGALVLCSFMFVAGCAALSGASASAATQPGGVTQSTSSPQPSAQDILNAVHNVTASPEAQVGVSLLGPVGSLALMGVNTVLGLAAAFYAQKAHTTSQSTAATVNTASNIANAVTNAIAAGNVATNAPPVALNLSASTKS